MSQAEYSQRRPLFEIPHLISNKGGPPDAKDRLLKRTFVDLTQSIDQITRDYLDIPGIAIIHLDLLAQSLCLRADQRLERGRTHRVPMGP